MADNRPCELLGWDSDFWGFRVARVLGGRLTREQAVMIDKWCRAQAVRCLYFLARSDDPETTRAAEDAGFRLVDVRVTLERQTEGVGGPTGHPDIETHAVRAVRPDDVGALQRIARSAYGHTRFYYDESFPPGRCDALYEAWITRSCEGYADGVLVAAPDGTPVGYVSCHLSGDESTGTIGLVGVSDRATGEGVGQALVLSALGWFGQRGARAVRVVTQGRNVAAQRLYQRCGFLTSQIQLWYHKWYAVAG